MSRKPDDGRKGSNQSSRDELLWLETYFIVFPKKRRPTLAQVEHALAAAGSHLRLENLSADDEGMFQSLLVESAEDHAAVEVSYDTSDAIIEQNLDWAKQLQKQLTGKQLQQIVSADARLEIAHYERVQHGAAKPAADAPKLRGDEKSRGPSRLDIHHERADDEWFDDEDNAAGDEFGDSFDDDYDEEAAMESFDPTCLLTVVEALATLTKGITFDPASGEVV